LIIVVVTDFYGKKRSMVMKLVDTDNNSHT